MLQRRYSRHCLCLSPPTNLVTFINSVNNNLITFLNKKIWAKAKGLSLFWGNRVPPGPLLSKCKSLVGFVIPRPPPSRIPCCPAALDAAVR